MSTLKVTHLQNESNSAPSISISSAVGGGVTFAGISTFHGSIRLGTDIEGHPSADDLTIATSSNTGITLRSGASNQGSLYFSDATSGGGEYAGWLRYSHLDNDITIGVAENERFCITSGGNVNIGGNYAETSHTLNISDSTKPSLCLHTGTTQRADFSATTGITSIRSFSNSPFTINIGGSGETEAFRIAGNGDIGINKSSITSWGASIPTIEIKGRAESGGQAPRSGAIAFESGSGSDGYAILWGNEGGIEYYSSATNRASAAYGCKFTSTGNLAFASGKGINFYNYGSGSNIDSNLLDDYEEGNWTPTPGSGANQWAAISVSSPCRYIKIGKLCTCWAVFERDDPSVPTGANLEIYGLPFTTANTGILSVHGNYWADNGGVTTDTAGSNIYLAPNNTRLMFVRLHDKDEGIHPDIRYFQTNDLDDGRPIYVSFTYETA